MVADEPGPVAPGVDRGSQLVRATGFARLAGHYWSTFGPFGAAALVGDRLARRILPTWVYRHTWGATKYISQSVQRDVIPKDTDAKAFRARFPESVQQTISAADEVLGHRFDILGSGPTDWGDPINWHEDIKSGHTWPTDFYTSLSPSMADTTGVDVKTAWELSRLHHGMVLAQAHLLTGEEKYRAGLAGQWASWQTANPFALGINWTSAMEASIRAVNVIYAVALVSVRGGERSPLISLSKSMREHGIFIERNLEVGAGEVGAGSSGLVTGNHYLANLCGLACIGLALPELSESARWVRVGLTGLEREARRQVLPDGLFWEGSTSYHRLALELLLIPALMARRIRAEVGTAYWETLERMCEAVMRLTGPDGTVPLVGDNDDGRLLITSGYPNWPRTDLRYLLAVGAALFTRPDMKAAAGEAPPELFWLLGEQGLRDYDSLPAEPARVNAHAFAEGGLCVLRGDRDGDYALLRSGGAVPGAPTGHLHNDALSIDLWLGGERVTVDPGTLAYTSDQAARDGLRSVSSHATVSLDGREPNRMVPGSPFVLRVESEVELIECRSDDSVRTATARASWPGGGSHTRTVSYDRRTGDWRVEDAVTGAQTAAWSWPLAPGREALGAQVEADFPLTESVEESRMSPSYGVSVPIRIVRYEGKIDGEGRAVFTFQASREPTGKASDHSATATAVGGRE